jgi:hypothetical protein
LRSGHFRPEPGAQQSVFLMGTQWGIFVYRLGVERGFPVLLDAASAKRLCGLTKWSI